MGHNDHMRRAFTLIELLVVIAIIAILAAILFPVFGQAKQAAKKTASMSNMKQIGIASMMYLADNDDVTPSLYWYDSRDLGIPSTQGFYYFPVRLLNYTKNEQVFLCPNDRDDDPALHDSKGRGRFDPLNELHYYIMGANPSYGYNYRYLNIYVDKPDPNGSNPLPFHYIGLSISAIGHPASTVMFGEATMKDKMRPNTNQPITTTIGYSRIEPPSRWLPGQWPDARTQGQLWGRFKKDSVIITWLDGHAKFTPISRLKGQPDTTETLDRYWNGLMTD